VDAIDLIWLKYERELKRHKGVIRGLKHELWAAVQRGVTDERLGQTYLNFGDSGTECSDVDGDQRRFLDVRA
jgi:hypothetical protein